MITWVLLAILAILLLLVVGAFIGRHLRLRAFFGTVAATLCDPGSSQVSFFVRTFVVRGAVDGHLVRFTTTGDVRGTGMAHTYLLLEHPIRGNFRFYHGSDIALIPAEIRSRVEAIEQIPGFYALIFTSRKTPLAARLLSRPIGLGYKPGLLLCTVEKASFEPDLLRKRFGLLIDLALHGA